jgi:short-subunit dehydrogenase
VNIARICLSEQVGCSDVLNGRIMMNIFLTGATGYIGSIVARRLKETGHTVFGLARSESSAQKLKAL